MLKLTLYSDITYENMAFFCYVKLKFHKMSAASFIIYLMNTFYKGNPCLLAFLYMLYTWYLIREHYMKYFSFFMTAINFLLSKKRGSPAHMQLKESSLTFHIKQ
ncbi:hypothetical protein KIL84_013274 [Mauremys mutica]|uniref:Uncharacterized protein n=1 Tax=Mauremys mutica TaxID=74926 RepID=A0A9D3WQW6_9SAUR|nr:hypothetical protein KIL84_013274 [Mauremys mutica]